MSEKSEAEVSVTPEKEIERVGDLLRKERITRRITIETIAKDLKLNVRYIKALEASEYEGLPADPYVRVYLKSLAKYLTLDPDQILKQFYQERGLSTEVPSKTATVKVSMTTEKESKNPILIITLALIIILGVIMYIGNNKGWFSNNTEVKTPITTDSLTEKNVAETTVSDSILDSLYAKTGVPAETLGTKTDTVVAKKVDVATKDTLQFSLTSSRDSVWVQVFYDGKSWKNFIRKGQTRVFTALDSFNVNVGNNRYVKYLFNGKPITIEGAGVVTFRLDKNGVESWNMTKWKETFKGRP